MDLMLAGSLPLCPWPYGQQSGLPAAFRFCAWFAWYVHADLSSSVTIVYLLPW